MKRDVGPHIADDVLEKYVMNTLAEQDVGPVEEHLLVCSDCQERVTETEEFIQVTKAALRDGEHKPAARAARAGGHGGVLHSWFTLPLLSAAVAAVVLGFVLPRHAVIPQAGPNQVRLYAMRGSDSLKHALAGEPLTVDLEASELSPALRYRVNVVNSEGKQVWSGLAEQVGSDIRITLDPAPRPGRYWFRVYRDTDLVREYGLELQ